MDTVYVVDADAGIRNALQTFLESFNVPVQAFPDANAFLHAGGEKASGCVVIEAELPGLNGLGLLKHLRDQGNDIPVLLLVDTATPEFTHRALQAGASGVLEKPLANDDIVARLERIFGVDSCGLGEAYSQSEMLSDGAGIVIRPIQPSDRAIEQAFVRKLSVRSKHRRFFAALKELPDAMLNRFTEISYPDNVAFIATIDDSGVETEIGVARYANTIGGNAEFAVAVADAWQGRGVGTLLLQRLMRCSETAGFTKIVGTVLRENRGMLKLARELGFESRIDPDDTGLVHLSRGNDKPDLDRTE